jgi:hypothetical protein
MHLEEMKDGGSRAQGWRMEVKFREERAWYQLGLRPAFFLEWIRPKSM